MSVIYHGSNIEISLPSLTYGRTDADFGRGFYVTEDLGMAEKWAARKGHPVVNVYKIDFSRLTGMEFKPDKAWLDFVCQNRGSGRHININLDGIDYITGITADDKLFSVMEQYEDDLIDADTAIRCMDSMKIGRQIALVSENAINSIKFAHSYLLTDERRQELAALNRQARKESDNIVKQIIRSRNHEKKLSPSPSPIIRYKSQNLENIIEEAKEEAQQGWSQENADNNIER